MKKFRPLQRRILKDREDVQKLREDTESSEIRKELELSEADLTNAATRLAACAMVVGEEEE